MTAGFILIVVMMVLGGVIATVSDRLGTKVGKARLSLFNLRPRHTAAFVTILTGSVLSALTLSILFAASKPLRTGVFRLDEIQKRLNQARKELSKTEDEKALIEIELGRARVQQGAALARLHQINQSLQGAIAQQSQTEAKLNRAQKQLSQIEAAKQSTEAQLQQVQAAKTRTESQLQRVKAEQSRTESQLNYTQNQLKLVSGQKQALRREIQQLQAERQKLIQQRDQVQSQIEQRDREIAQQDQLIAQKDQVIVQREASVDALERQKADLEKQRADLEAQKVSLEEQKAYLTAEVQVLGRDFQALRGGTVALQRGQVLASGVVRIVEPTAATQAVDQLLQEANRNAIQMMKLGNLNSNQDQLIQITKAEVEQLVNEIDDGQDYVVRVFAGANYLVGEKRILVFVDAELNRLIFPVGEVVTAVSLEPNLMTEDRIREWLDGLIEAVKFRARFAGIVASSVQIGDDRIETLINFVEQLQRQQQSLEVQAVVSENTYTAGPLKINLVAVQNGQVIFHTGQKPEAVPTKEDRGKMKDGMGQINRLPSP